MINLINLDRIKEHIKNETRQALEMALDEGTRRAKEHAPVRDVFLGGRGPSRTSESRWLLKPSQVDDPSDRSGRARPGHPMLMGESGTKRIRKGLQEQQEFLSAVKQQRKRGQRGSFAQVDKFGELTGKFKTETASSRSHDPIVSDAFGEARRGDFRNVTGYEVKDGEIVLPGRVMRGRKHLAEPVAQGERSRQPLLRKESVEGMLNPQGRAELKRHANLLASGRDPRSANSAFHTTSAGRVELGGRLRDEIYRTSARDTGKSISGWVVSPTPYAKYQEYGTSRHRPQPYMRPMLYEMRERLPTIINQRLRRIRL